MSVPSSTSGARRPTQDRPPGQPHSAWQSGALQAIFALFLGVIVALVVGVGVNTFHPNPADATRAELEQLYQSQQLSMAEKADQAAPTTAEDQRLDARILQLEELARQQEQEWAAATSIVVVILATLLLAAAVALAQVAAAWVFSTGLLLGGIFTMLYGVILSMMSGQSVLRFVLLLVALAITSGLGYLRFVRGGRRGPGAVPAATSAGVPPDVEQRLTRVEKSLDSLRHALRDL